MCSEPTSFQIEGVTTDPQLSHDEDRSDSIYPAPLDCVDLAETFRTDKAAAIRLLKTLTPTQLNLEALAYAAYLNQLHGLDLEMDDILVGWQRGLGFDTR